MKRIIMFAILVFFGFMLFGCSTQNNTIINTNQFYQTDYDYFCFDGNKTWSQIVVCLKAQDDAEKAQNQVTNELLDNK